MPKGVYARKQRVDNPDIQTDLTYKPRKAHKLKIVHDADSLPAFPKKGSKRPKKWSTKTKTKKRKYTKRSKSMNKATTRASFKDVDLNSGLIKLILNAHKRKATPAAIKRIKKSLPNQVDGMLETITNLVIAIDNLNRR